MKLLIVSDTPYLQTGLGRVTRELGTRLQSRHQVEIAGWFHPKAVSPSLTNGFTIHPLATRELGFETLEPLCRTGGFDAVIGIGDPWYFGYLGQLRWIHRARGVNTPWVGYLTIDGDPLPDRFKTFLNAFDRIVCCTEYGRSALSRIEKRRIEVIPYGVDVEVFKPLDRELIRRQMGLQDAFVVLMDAQNIPRKNLWAALEAFQLFQPGKSTVLYAFTNIDDPNGLMLRDVIQQFDIETRAKIIASMQADAWSGLDDQSLNVLYNAADVLVLPSMNEGFGLPILQALAVGVMPIGTQYASIPELIGSYGKTIKPAAYFSSEWGLRCAVIDPQDLADSLAEVYLLWESRRSWPEAWRQVAREYASRYSWQEMSDRLDAVLGDVCGLTGAESSRVVVEA